MPVITLDDIKAHLNITTDDDDTLLTEKLAVAEVVIANYVGDTDLTVTYPDAVPAPLQEAIRQYAAHLYAYREGVPGAETAALMTEIQDLIGAYRAWNY